MVGLRPHPLSRSIAAWAPFRRSADADRAGNDPARAARATGRVSENRPRPGAHGPDADCDHCRVLAAVTGASAHLPLPNNASSRNAPIRCSTCNRESLRPCLRVDAVGDALESTFCVSSSLTKSTNPFTLRPSRSSRFHRRELRLILPTTSHRR